MEKRAQILAGAYSFCLPGLGQFYNKRFLPGLIFNICFYTFEWNEALGLGKMIPLLALSSALEAFLHTRNSEQLNPKYRDYLYASIASVSLFFWILAFAPYVIPMKP